jgi:hypothetical protein
MVKELELLKIIVPDEFVVGGIIAKLPPSWRDFTTTLKHKRTHMSISNQCQHGALAQSHGKDKGKKNKNNNKPK